MPLPPHATRSGNEQGDPDQLLRDAPDSAQPEDTLGAVDGLDSLTSPDPRRRSELEAAQKVLQLKAGSKRIAAPDDDGSIRQLCTRVEDWRIIGGTRPAADGGLGQAGGDGVRPMLELKTVMFDVTPGRLVGKVVTDVGEVPPSAVPSIVRMRDLDLEERAFE